MLFSILPWYTPCCRKLCLSTASLVVKVADVVRPGRNRRSMPAELESTKAFFHYELWANKSDGKPHSITWLSAVKILPQGRTSQDEWTAQVSNFMHLFEGALIWLRSISFYSATPWPTCVPSTFNWPFWLRTVRLQSSFSCLHLEVFFVTWTGSHGGH